MFRLVLVIFIFCSFSSYSQNNWFELGNFNGGIKAIYTDRLGNLYAGGYFTNDSGYYFVAKWDGIKWYELGGINSFAANSLILSITGDNFGNIYAAGNFTNSSRKNYVAQWNGKNWLELGGTNSMSADWNIRSICCDSIGNLFAVGGFSNGNGKSYVAKWNKASNKWDVLKKNSGIDFNANNTINTIITDKTGSVFASGSFNDSQGKYSLSKWSNLGNTWDISGIGGWTANAPINQICKDKSGNVYVCGRFTNGLDSVKGKFYVAIWNGKFWSELGGINALAANASINSIYYDEHSHSLIAAGDFTKKTDSTTYNYVAKWDGAKWSQLGDSVRLNGVVETICGDSVGNIYVSGWIKNSSGKYYVGIYRSNIVLPVKLSSFNAVENERNQILGSFQATNELNVLSYTIERSYDSNHFAPISTFSVKNEGEMSKYLFVDNSFDNSTNVIYYRVATLHSNNVIHYTSLVKVVRNNLESCQIVPNCISNNNLRLRIFSNTNKYSSVAIFNENGKLIFNKRLTLSLGINFMNIVLPNISVGSYFLTLDGINKTSRFNIVK